jgi:hypothetical protein
MDLFHTSTHTFVTSADFHVAINSGYIGYIEINNCKHMKYDAEIFKKLNTIFSELSKLKKIVFFGLNDVDLQSLFKNFEKDKSIEFQEDKSKFGKNRQKVVY